MGTTYEYYKYRISSMSVNQLVKISGNSDLTCAIISDRIQFFLSYENFFHRLWNNK